MKQDQTQYYKQRILKLMSLIEDKTNRMFHETHPELERSIWMTMDNGNDRSGLIYITDQLSGIFDEVNK